MRWATIQLAMWGIAAGWFIGLVPNVRAEGFWITLAAGLAGASAPSDYAEFWFDTQHGPPLAIVSLSGAATIQATTAGGTTLFSPLGTPVLLPTHNGYATLTPSNGSVAPPSIPSSAIPRFSGSPLASGAPSTGLPVPADAPRLNLGISPSAPNGSQVVTVDVTDPNGNLLGSGQVTVPQGGWWVIGLGPDNGGANNGNRDNSGNNSNNNSGNNNNGGLNDPLPPNPPPLESGDPNSDESSSPPTRGVPGPTPPQRDPSGPVATPEPGSLLMVALGGLTMASWRRRRRSR